MQKCSQMRIAKANTTVRIAIFEIITTNYRTHGIATVASLPVCSELEARTRPEDAFGVGNKDCQCKNVANANCSSKHMTFKRWNISRDSTTKRD
jgi:hypothetical protein